MTNKDYKDEAYINELVDTYKATENEATRLALISCFDPYFRKYANLLASRYSVDLSNKDTMNFLRLFMSTEDRKDNFTLINGGKRTISYLRSLFKDCTPDELYDEVLCIFLEQLARYKPMIAEIKPDKPRISFTHFIQVNVKFKLAALIMKRKKDALHCQSNLQFIDDLSPAHEPEVGVNWNTLDLQWVRGETASEVFQTLDELERYLLYLQHSNEEEKPKSEYDLAKLTGLDRMYIRRRLFKVREKLKEAVNA
jgi:hypothetical protein